MLRSFYYCNIITSRLLKPVLALPFSRTFIQCRENQLLNVITDSVKRSVLPRALQPDLLPILISDSLSRISYPTHHIFKAEGYMGFSLVFLRSVFPVVIGQKLLCYFPLSLYFNMLTCLLSSYGLFIKCIYNALYFKLFPLLKKTSAT